MRKYRLQAKLEEAEQTIQRLERAINVANDRAEYFAQDRAKAWNRNAKLERENARLNNIINRLLGDRTREAV